MEKVLHASALEQWPAVDHSAVEEALKKELDSSSMKWVVLDDDPTGVQTVHDVTVYTDWSVESFKSGFQEENRLFYVLTNSRGLTVDETTRVHREIAENAAAAAKETHTNYLFISRSDSTLRGHYPLETDILRRNMEKEGLAPDGEILCFFFKEGGRFTLNDIHYVKYGEELVPAAQTEFAGDRTFGYTHSSLPEYIEEKTDGAYRADDVVCISLEELRAQDYDGIAAKLETVSSFGKVVVNAVDYCDVKVFAVALYRALAKGKRFLFRSAAGLVKVLGGISDIPLLRRGDMVRTEQGQGGIVVVGSHTAKTTAQLKELLKLQNTEAIEFNSDLVLEGDDALAREVERCVLAEEAAIRNGKVAVCYTCRRLLTVENDTAESALRRSVKISEAVQNLVGKLSVTPAFVVAKGGITSSTIGTEALGVKKAMVLGQVCPGIAVWQTGSESKFPGIPYVIFPGNVGTEETLREAVEILTEE